MPEAILRPLRALVATTFIAMSLPAFAASQRTFVASYGQDANAAAYGCSLAHPCRTFAGALPQVNAGGEVVVLDSAGYGAFTVDKAVSVIAPPAVQASITVAAGNGVTVAAGATDAVRLVGLTIVGQGGDAGILFQSGASLTVDRCAISGALYAGVDVRTGGMVRVAEANVEINAYFGTAVRVEVQNASVVTEIIRSRISSSNGNGIEVMAKGRLAVHDCTISGNASSSWQGIYVRAALLSAPISAHVSRTMITGWGYGVWSEQLVAYTSFDIVDSDLAGNATAVSARTGATVALDRNRIVHSQTAIETQNGGIVYTSGNNYFAYNASDLGAGVTLAGPGGYR
jgi:hypothetical protein